MLYGILLICLGPAAAIVPGEPAVAAGHALEAGVRGRFGAVMPQGAWRWPLTPAPVVRGFAAPPTRYAAGHRGIDLAAPAGAAVFAPAGGIVRFRGRVVDREVVTLALPGDILVSLEPVAGVLRPGDRVAAGTRLGTVDSGGHCRGCLHLGVRVQGDYVSPLLFLAGVPRAVLLPLP